jgi:hypothetical protein
MYKQDPSLGSWVHVQRRYRDSLHDEQRAKLEDLGFSWDVFQARFEESFQFLVEYHETHGHCNVPQRYQQNPALGSWVLRQRARKAFLSDEQRAKLDNLGFSWSLSRTWEESFQVLVQYHDTHGNSNVAMAYPQDPTFSLWVRSQRQRINKLSQRQRAKLDALDFSWRHELFDDQWNEMYTWLVRYAQEERNGDCNIPTGTQNVTTKRLEAWVTTQRSRKALLSIDQRTKLDQLGFLWTDSSQDKWNRHWNAMYQRLIDYKRINGHCNIPKEWEEDRPLARWVGSQRVLFKKGLLSDDRIRQLEKLQFLFSIHARTVLEYDDLMWNRHYKMLRWFLGENGHCNVPPSYEKDGFELGAWVQDQRRIYGVGSLREDRMEILNDLGFSWILFLASEPNVEWDRHYEMLLAFRQDHGDCNVPRRGYEKDHSLLGEWVSMQRIYHENGTLRNDRKDRLDDVGFSWILEELQDDQWNEKYDRLFLSHTDRQWERRYEMLLAFRQEHFHCDVPKNYAKDKSFGAWVYNQRKIYRTVGLAKDRKELLDRVGFSFERTVEEIHDALWGEQYEELKRFQQSNGHLRLPSGSRLGNWAYRQRARLVSGKLGGEQKTLLDEMGFPFDLIQRQDL